MRRVIWTVVAGLILLGMGCDSYSRPTATMPPPSAPPSVLTPPTLPPPPQ